MVNMENLNRTMAENGKLANKFIGAYQSAIRKESLMERYETRCIRNPEEVIVYEDIREKITKNYENAGHFLCILNSLSGKTILDGYLNCNDTAQIAAVCSEIDQWYFNNAKTRLSETTRRFREDD